MLKEKTLRQADRSFSRGILVWMLGVTAISPSFAFGAEYRPELFVVTAALSPLIFLTKAGRRWIPAVDVPSLILMLAFIPATLIFHPGSIRWMSALFGCACLTFFMGFVREARTSALNYDDFARILQIIIYLFAGTLVIQQICVATGLPVPNPGRPYANPWKLNSLTSEPSISTQVVCLLLLFFLLCRTSTDRTYCLKKSLNKDYAVWIAATWVCWTTANATAWVLFPLPFFAFLRKRYFLVNFLFLAGATTLALGLAYIAGAPQAQRAFKAVRSYATLSEEEIINNEESSGLRPLPTLEIIRATDFSINSLLTGHGADAEKEVYSEKIKAVSIHPMTRVWYDYGLPAQIALWFLVISSCYDPRRKATIVTTILALIYSGGTSDQTFWLIMCLSAIFRNTSFFKIHKSHPHDLEKHDTEKRGVNVECQNDTFTGNRQKKRILAAHLLDDRSGSAIVLSSLIQYLARLGHRMSILSSGHGPLEEASEISRKNVLGCNGSDRIAVYHHVSYTFRGQLPMGVIRFIKAQTGHLLKAIRLRKEYDLVYANTILTVGAALGGALCGKEIVCHCHENPSVKGKAYRILWKIMNLLSDKVICVSKAQMEALKSQRQIWVVNNPVRPEFYHIQATNYQRSHLSPNIVMASSLRTYKGIAEFFQLAASMEGEAMFTFASDASPEEIAGYAKQHDLSVPSNMRFARGGSVEAMAGIYNEATTVVNLSNPELFEESYGLSIAEGQACRLPAIVPCVGGIAALVENGVDGFHINGKDTEGLRKAIREIHVSENAYSSFSNAAGRAGQKHEPANAAQLISDIIET